MLPIPGETYQEYLDRVSATDNIAYTIQELRDMGWEELDNGELWIAQLGVEPTPVEPPAFPPDITDEPEQPGEEPITLVTIYFLVWCVDPDTGEIVGPYTQMIDVDWYSVTIFDIESQVDAAAKLFCQLASWRTSARNVSERDVQEYDWEIISPFGLRYSHGI